MEAAKTAFRKIVRDALFFFNRGIRVREHLHRINEAIVGARSLGIIPMEVARFSKDETAELGRKIQAFAALNMKREICEMITGKLQERGVPSELLDPVSVEIAANRFV